MIKMLYVDECKHAYEMMKRCLVGVADVLYAPNVSEARALLNTTSVDAVLAEYNLGHHKGDTILRYVAIKHPQTKRFLITNMYPDELPFETDAEFLTGFFEKPIDVDELIETLRKLNSNVA
jgi:response regulator RpfG family c-di-GMP phosphodiesterase